MRTSCDLSEDLGQQRGAAGDLPARPFEPVLLVAALELLEVEGGGMLHEAHAGEIAVALGEQAVDEGTRPAEKVGRDGKRGLRRTTRPPSRSAGRSRASRRGSAPAEAIWVWATTSSMMSLPT